MLERIGQLGCLVLLLALSGCTGLFGRDGIPADPLFHNGKPRESKCHAGPPILTPFSEPPLPVNNHIVEPR